MVGVVIYVRELCSVIKNFDWNDYFVKVKRGFRVNIEMNFLKINLSYGRIMIEVVMVVLEEVMVFDIILNCVLILFFVCVLWLLSVNVVVYYLMNMGDNGEDKDVIILKMKKNILLIFYEEKNGIYV